MTIDEKLQCMRDYLDLVALRPEVARYIQYLEETLAEPKTVPLSSLLVITE
jgi:hypothetical protein